MFGKKYNNHFKKLQGQPETNHERTVSFSSEVTIKRYNLTIEQYVDYVDARVSNKSISFDVTMPALVIDAVKEEDMKELMYSLRAAVIAAVIGEEVEGEVTNHE